MIGCHEEHPASPQEAWLAVMWHAVLLHPCQYDSSEDFGLWALRVWAWAAAVPIWVTVMPPSPATLYLEDHRWEYEIIKKVRVFGLEHLVAYLNAMEGLAEQIGYESEIIEYRDYYDSLYEDEMYGYDSC